ncbi:MAG: hemerythrin domain-containing protein [Cyclobacteriaceae bacterium]|jgi:iron-sulfur cluster repair protein YtfE (RIC family)|nr:hemerythrin domain-containing protein [Cyclobacteriaceae bacterium]
MKEKAEPLKRIKELQPLSHDHHHSLLLSWKIRTGIRKGIPLNRIKRYLDFFFESRIVDHFSIEEEYVFPILREHKLVKRALADHRLLKRLFTAQTDLERNLVLIEEKLEDHIRFEERILFTEIQKAATAEELNQINLIHQDDTNREDNWDDEFWK